MSGLQNELLAEITNHRDKNIAEFIGELHKILNISIEVEQHKPYITEVDDRTLSLSGVTFTARVNGEITLRKDY